MLDFRVIFQRVYGMERAQFICKTQVNEEFGIKISWSHLYDFSIPFTNHYPYLLPIPISLRNPQASLSPIKSLPTNYYHSYKI